MSRKVTLNPGAQEAFVLGDEKYSAYIGGLGSGKTYAGLLRGLKYSLQPKVGFHAPFGVIAVSSYPALNDIIIPKLTELMDTTGLADWERDYSKSKKELTLINGSVIRLRSLDNPEVVARGPEYSWFYIDEGRNVGINSWKNLTSRLRQKGYKRAGFVGSTPNGFDWMYDVFHKDGARHATEYPEAKWYNAAMFENIHLDEDYLTSMAGNWSGRYYEQEVMGKFIGIVEGGVFDQWDPITQFVPDLEYDPSLPLYSFWDFGVGDPGVCIFAQVEWRPVQVGLPGKMVTKRFPFLNILYAHENADWTAKDWAAHYHDTLKLNFRGARTKGDYGDPAGTQRNPATGSSVIRDLNSAGVPVRPVKRRPQDYAIRILNNMMAGGRVFVGADAKRVSDAFSSHKWHLKDGVRIGLNPVHDWTSHFVDAVRYGASVLLPFSPRDDESGPDGTTEYQPNQWGYVFEQLDEEPERWIGSGPRRRPTFTAPTIRAR